MSSFVDNSVSFSQNSAIFEQSSIHTNGTGFGSLKEAEDRLETEWKKAAKRENTYVQGCRFGVFVALVVAASVVSAYVHAYIRSDQIEGFESSFNANADKIIKSFHESIKRRLEAVDTLSLSITSYVKSAENVSWPFVTVPDYEIRASNARVLSLSFVINFFPLVKESEREEWNRYANRTGLIRHNAARESDTEQRTALDGRLGIEPPARDRRLQRFNESVAAISPSEVQEYLPNWQESPVLPGHVFLNYDIYGDPAAGGAYASVLDTGKAALGPAIVHQPDSLYIDYLRTVYSLSQYRMEFEDVAFDPTSALGYPVFDTFDHESRRVVGLLGLNVNWRTIFKNVLPSNVLGMYCVIENTFNQTYTFRVDGTRAVFIGEGDWHDKSYDYLEQYSDSGDYLKTLRSVEAQSYTSVDLDTDFCSFRLRVYPSKDTETYHRNSDATLVALLVVGVFLFTSIVFVAYDYLVGRRQRNIMRRAVTSSAIVSSLFPSQVREQLYDEKEKNEGKRKGSEQEKESPEDAFRRMAHSSFQNLGDQPSDTTTTRPIANRFENTTIMFADLAGFTKWSSERSPEDVFELLEALYQKFDQKAKLRRVFKVETIGDCYLAVTGLPEPQAFHAVILAKFASDCIRHTREITSKLSDRLGEDTVKLELRVGLHTGPVTAGVLRGEKARFQLFGDSVNTASRMESTGAPGRVHVSEETARELESKGKEHWLTARPDMVTAKGKGSLQTYWLQIANSTMTASSGASYLLENSINGDLEDAGLSVDEVGDSLEI